MSAMEILPFEHPTTIALVDDDADFLSSFGLAQRRESGPLKSFYRPQDVINAFRRQRRQPVDPAKPGAEACIADADRFATFSVLITDYEMGPLSGVDVCRQIEDRAVGRIMVTGKVDERYAVRAFNENLIDRYLRKDDPELVELTSQYVTELKQEYFLRSAAHISESIYRTRAGFLFVDQMAAIFEESRQQNGVVEYYLSMDLPGFLMLDAEGELLLSIWLSDARMSEHLERAENLDAPRQLIDLLRAGTVVPCFPGEGGFYSPKFAKSWKEWAFAAVTLKGMRKYHQAVFTGPAAHALVTGLDIYPYQRYLDES